MCNFIDVEEVRDEILGLRVVDFIGENNIIFLENEEGRIYTIEATQEGMVVNKGSTTEEEFEMLKVSFNLLLQKLDVDEDELWDEYYK